MVVAKNVKFLLNPTGRCPHQPELEGECFWVITSMLYRYPFFSGVLIIPAYFTQKAQSGGCKERKASIKPYRLVSPPTGIGY